MKQPYDNPTCKIHKDPYLWNGTWWECGFNKHLMPKEFCLIKNQESGHGWSEWDYEWVEKNKIGGRECILKVSELIYSLIKEYEKQR